jgi:hypothetical protein
VDGSAPRKAWTHQVTVIDKMTSRKRGHGIISHKKRAREEVLLPFRGVVCSKLRSAKFYLPPRIILLLTSLPSFA